MNRVHNNYGVECKHSTFSLKSITYLDISMYSIHDLVDIYFDFSASDSEFRRATLALESELRKARLMAEASSNSETNQNEDVIKVTDSLVWSDKGMKLS